MSVDLFSFYGIDICGNEPTNVNSYYAVGLLPKQIVFDRLADFENAQLFI